MPTRLLASGLSVSPPFSAITRTIMIEKMDAEVNQHCPRSPFCWAHSGAVGTVIQPTEQDQGSPSCAETAEHPSQRCAAPLGGARAAAEASDS